MAALYRSAQARLLWPPITRTSPSERRVAVWALRKCLVRGRHRPAPDHAGEHRAPTAGSAARRRSTRATQRLGDPGGRACSAVCSSSCRVCASAPPAAVFSSQSSRSARAGPHVFGEFLETVSSAALEVLAIVAYEQPVTRADIRGIRGVDSDGPVETLISQAHRRGSAGVADRDSWSPPKCLCEIWAGLAQ